MDSKIIILFLIVISIFESVIGAEIPQICPENQEPTNCVNLCLPTCVRPFYVACNFGMCIKGCDCKPGYVRTTWGGPCVAIEDCGAYCHENQEYTSCGSQCPDNCRPKNETCYTDACVKGCYCKKDYVLEHDFGECILKTSCPVLDG